MKFNEYVLLAMRTCKPLPHDKHIAHMAIGVIGEMGELADAYKRSEIYGKELDNTNVEEEIGDLFWYVAGLYVTLPSSSLDVDLKRFSIPKEDLIRARSNVIHLLIDYNTTLSSLCSDIMSSDFEGDAETVTTATITLLAGVTLLAQILDVDVHKALDRNIAKLAARYGDKYSDYAAIHRNVIAERTVLEDNI